jgi:hypothetical protein
LDGPSLRAGTGPQIQTSFRFGWVPPSARGHRAAGSLNFHSAPCIAVQRGAKFADALPQPFVCLVDRTRPMWLEFRLSVSEHCQRFGNCLGFAIPARQMDHCFARCDAVQYCTGRAGAAGMSAGQAGGRAMRSRENRLGERNTNLRSFPPSHAATADGCVVKHKFECIGNSDGAFHFVPKKGSMICSRNWCGGGGVDGECAPIGRQR